MPRRNKNSYRNKKFGHELWHKFFTAALTGLISKAYDKGDLDPHSAYALKDVRKNVIFEAVLIADQSMDLVILRSVNQSSYADADDLLVKARKKEMEAFEKELKESLGYGELRREADLKEEFSGAELQEMKDV
jgi:hypothetical protein